MFYVGTLPMMLVFFVMRAAARESPRWLVSKGRLAEADAVVAGIERAVAAQGKTLPPPRPGCARARQTSRWQEIFERPLSPPHLLGLGDVVLLLLDHLRAPGLAADALPHRFPPRPRRRSNLYGMITQCCGIFGSFVCAFTIDKTGRRPWFMFAFLGGAATLLALAAVGQGSAERLLFFVSTGGFFMSTASLGLNLYTSELYPTRIRAFGGAVGGAWQRVAAAIGPLVVGYLAPLYGLGPVFLYFGGLAFIGAVVTLFFAEETGGRSLEEVSP